MKVKNKKYRRTAKHFYYCLVMASIIKRKKGGKPYYFEKQAQVASKKIKAFLP